MSNLAKQDRLLMEVESLHASKNSIELGCTELLTSESCLHEIILVRYLQENPRIS
jgi:hypothetical protein